MENAHSGFGALDVVVEGVFGEMEGEGENTGHFAGEC